MLENSVKHHRFEGSVGIYWMFKNFLPMKNVVQRVLLCLEVAVKCVQGPIGLPGAQGEAGRDGEAGPPGEAGVSGAPGYRVSFS